MEREDDELSPEMDEFGAFLEREAEGMADDLVSNALAAQARRLDLASGVRVDIATTWRDGWQLFEALLFGMEQHGLHMAERAIVDDEHWPVRTALVALHASATMTLHEIHTLLQEGLVTGAAARWRGLHELAVTAILVARGEAPIAKRYLDHGYVVHMRRLEAFYAQPHPDAPSDEVRQERLDLADELVALHSLPDQSTPFHRPYGWAIPLMNRRQDGRYLEPTFERIEAKASLSHLRILVNSSHGSVHNDSGGIRTSVYPDDESVLFNRRTDQIDTVARPTCDTLIAMVAATHLGFEPELNDFARLIGLLGASLCAAAARARDAFRPADPTSLRLF